MKVIRFSWKKHSDYLQLLLSMHGHQSLGPDALPINGFVVMNDADTQMIACGFIRMCEGGVALFDGLTVNRLYPRDIKDKALDAVVTACINQCKKLKLKQLLGFSKNTATLERSKRHGFKAMPEQAVISLDLTKI